MSERCSLSRARTRAVEVASPARIMAGDFFDFWFVADDVLALTESGAVSIGVLLASDQRCVREYIEPGKNGLLADFFDVEGLAKQAVEVLHGDAVKALAHEFPMEFSHMEEECELVRGAGAVFATAGPRQALHALGVRLLGEQAGADVDLGRDGPGHHAIHTNLLRPQFGRKDLGQRLNGPLGGRVG